MSRSKPKRRPSKMKMDGHLSGFAKLAKSKNSTLLLDDIKKFVLAESIRSPNTREKQRVHVSDWIRDHDWCSRKEYYKLTGTETTDPGEVFEYHMQSVFETGNTLHRKWQNWLWKMGELWGEWRCLTCEHEWIDTSPEKCPECETKGIEYKEVPLSHATLPVVGHPDGAVKPLRALVEIKSFAVGTVRIEAPSLVREATVKADGKDIVNEAVLWEKIKKPLRAHLLQGMVYLWLCREAGLEFDRMIFIYEWKANQKTKEFVVPFNMKTIEPLLDRMTGLMSMVEQETLPPRPASFERGKKPCKNCVFRTRCWEIDADDSKTPPQEGQPGRPVRVRRRRPGGEETPGATADTADPASPSGAPGDPRRSDRVDRPKADAVDDTIDEVGRVHGDPVGLRGGGRKVCRVSDGEVSRTLVTRRPVKER